MNLIITNTNLDELTAICSRIGTPSFYEIEKAEKENGNLNEVANSAENYTEYEDKVQKKIDQAVKAGQSIKNEKPEPKAQKPKQEKPEPELHLDGPPPSEITLHDLQILSGEIVKAGRRDALEDYLSKKKYASILKVEKENYSKVYEDLKKIKGE